MQNDLFELIYYINKYMLSTGLESEIAFGKLRSLTNELEKRYNYETSKFEMV